MKRLKVYVVGEQKEYSNFLTHKFDLIDYIGEADIVIFTGGEDVTPGLYSDNVGCRTRHNLNRDIYERKEYQFAKTYNKFIIGICRGSQFLTVMNGGRLAQHIENHGIYGTHPIKCEDGNIVDITSTHHQMMWPFNLKKDEYNIIAHSETRLSDVYLDGYDEQKELPCDFVEPEIVFYPKTNCLCIQGHPEYMPKDSDAVKYINMLVEDLFSYDNIYYLSKPTNMESDIYNINGNDLSGAIYPAL